MTRIEEIKEGAYNTGYNVQSSYGDAFIDGAQWAENNPSVELLLKVFWIFDNNGLIDKNLSFDPEHFMETVVKYHWKDYDEKGRIKV